MIIRQQQNFVVALLLSLYSITLSVNADVTVPGMAVEFGGWRYIPLVENGEVHSFVALAVNPGIHEKTITSMWFVKEGDTWSGSAWHTQDHQAVLTDLKATLGLNDESDSDWPVEPGLRPTHSGTAVTRSPFVSGVFTSDPLLPAILAQSDPTEFLDSLVFAGWPASDARVFQSDNSLNQLLDGLAAGAILEIAQEGDGVEVLSQAVSSGFCEVEVLTLGLAGGGGGGGALTCCPMTIIGGVNSSGCVFRFWTFDGTSLVPAGGGGCYIQNSWIGSHFEFERRGVRVISSNCTSCTMTQTRTKNCAPPLAEVDFSAGVQNPCALPVGYTPPAIPSVGTSCALVNPNCGSWSGWSPSIASRCP